MTTIYINGREVRKEDLHKYEITSEVAKKILLNGIGRKGKNDN